MKVILTIILLISLCGLISCSDGHFTVFGLKSVNQNGKYSVAITTTKNFNNSNNPILEVAIHSKDGVGRIARNVTLTKNHNSQIEFDINGVLVGDYVHLTIICIHLNCNRTVQLNVAKNVSTYVQTDKAIYKPSDEVRFRVLVLDGNLRPLSNYSNVRMFVIDGAHNRVAEFPNAGSNKDFKKGVFEGKFYLSDSPVLGNWHIETILSNNAVTRQVFEVVENILQVTTGSVQLHAEPFKLLIKTMSKECKPGLPYAIEAIIRYPDMNVLITDNKNPVFFNVTSVEVKKCKAIENGTHFINVCSGGNTTWKVFKGYPTNGTAKIDFKVYENVEHFNVTVTYLQTSISKSEIQSASSEENHYIMIKSKTETPTLNENVKINIRSVKNFTEFSYHVFTTQGRLITTNTSQVSPTQDHDFEFTPTNVTESKIKIIVFYITDNGNIVSDSLQLEFSELKNFVDVQISKKSVPPNDGIHVNITTKPNSFVGLLGTLKRVNGISDKIKDETQSYAFNFICPGSKRFISFSGFDYNGEYHDDQEEKRDKNEIMGEPEDGYRTFFPETWPFDMVDFNEGESNKIIDLKAPDTITNWTIVAFSINPITGFAETSRPATLTVFKNFFISMDLPYSIKLNEIISIPISVFNYMENGQDANITLYNDDLEFEFVGRRNDNRSTKIIYVNGKSRASTSFQIRANRIGSIKMRASVKSLSSSGDGIERYLLVKPEGIVNYTNKAFVIDLSNSVAYSTSLNISIPPEAVKDSIKIEASLIGDVLGLSGNLEHLIKLPVGCSEQRMINFVTNVVVLDYLKATAKLTEEVENAAIDYLKRGYQTQLNYKNDDGSFNNWGQRNESGGTWLTAYIVKTFSQAKRYIFVESSIIKNGLDFLSKRQLDDGSFEEVGYVFRKDIQCASSNRIALTAYVLLTFLESSDYIKTYNNTIVNAMDFLEKNVNNETDNYSLAITAYALQLAHSRNGSYKNVCLTKLEQTSIRDGEKMRWIGSGSQFPAQNNTFDSQANSLDVETTAYALHAFVVAGRLNDSVRIMKWLVTQRNGNGGFISTLDTVVALQALSKVAAKINSSDINMGVVVKYKESSWTLAVDQSTALVLQTKSLPKSARSFNISAWGKGFSIFQISYQYNVKQFVEMHKFNISRPTISKTVDPKRSCLEFCVNYSPDKCSTTSNMAVLEVKFPTGSTFVENIEKELEPTKNIKDIKSHDTSVTAFFDHLSPENACQRFCYSESKFGNEHSPQDGSINVYDYYNIKHRAETFF